MTDIAAAQSRHKAEDMLAVICIKRYRSSRSSSSIGHHPHFHGMVRGSFTHFQKVAFLVEPTAAVGGLPVAIRTRMRDGLQQPHLHHLQGSTCWQRPQRPLDQSIPASQPPAHPQVVGAPATLHGLRNHRRNLVPFPPWKLTQRATKVAIQLMSLRMQTMLGVARKIAQAAGVLRSAAVHLQARTMNKPHAQLHPAHTPWIHPTTSMQHQPRAVHIEPKRFQTLLPARFHRSTITQLRAITARIVDLQNN
mmetsp:Transcript_86407/g.166323  ORF Transcript_86407/g.166323 Transcript_86407/m.166323 type:complete len:250 (-) Transcript_86407:388-1137(-)